ncbi:MAG: polyprenyl synthetase family protein, partial [Deltaproteobacteria bacterium]|nr:polyprenyl synthetase family protein [Deltaproteobacteria bacterium]
MKISAKDHVQLKSYLKATSEWIGEETLRRIPDGQPKEYLYDLMRDYPQRGGKRFRPALVLLSCELFGGDPEKAMTSAVALELFHNFALVHDAIEDESLLRRGEQTLHLQHGIALALNAGDALLGLVHETLLENHSKLDSYLAVEVHQHLSKVMQATFEGQALDIGWVANQTFPDRAEYHEMISRKTGWYSGRGPCICGALIAGAPKTDLEAVGRFGEAIGIGFQIRDDLLNLTEKSETEAPNPGAGGYGKEHGGDIAEGKRTLISIELLEQLSEKDAE